MIELSIVTCVLDIFIKPLLILTGVLYVFKYSTASSPQFCYWALVSVGGLALLFVPLSLLFPIPIIPVYVSGFQSNHVDVLLAGDGILLWQVDVGVGFYSAVALYYFGVFFLIAWHQYDFYHANRIADKSKAFHDPDFFERLDGCPHFFGKGVSIKMSQDIESPVVWGWIKPTLLVPEDWHKWHQERKQRVLTHELAHIRRGDWLIKNALRYVRAIFWFLPPCWVLVERVGTYAEYACDDEVIQSGVERADYAEDLLALSSTVKLSAGFVAIAMNELAIRINLILAGGRHRENIGAVKKIGLIVFSSLMILAFYAIEFKHVVGPQLEESTWVAYERPILKRYRAMSVLEGAEATQKEGGVSGGIEQNQEILRSQGVVLNAKPELERLRLAERKQEELGADFESTYLRSALISASIQSDVRHAAPLFHPRPESQISVQGWLPKMLVYPIYPKKALRRGIEARVPVVFNIDEHGSAGEIRFPEPNPSHQPFYSAIRRALNKSQFFITEIDGHSVQYLDAEEVFVFKIR